MSCKPKICIGDLKHGITIVRRTLGAAAPGSAEPVFTYTDLFHARAQIKTHGGTSLWNTVEIDGERASHTMTIRYTSTAFDIKDRVRDGAGRLFKLLKVENVDEGNDWLKLHCALQGSETTPAAR